MSIDFKFAQKIFQTIPGSVFCLISIFVGITGDIISAIMYPGYNITKNMISDLGTGPGAPFFNTCVIIAGIFAIPFLIYLGQILLNYNSENKKLAKTGIISATISSIALSLIGVFPAYKDNFIIFLIHGIIASICYITASIYIISFCVLIRKDERFNNIFGYTGYIIGVFFIITLFTWIPLIQWITNICIILWLFFLAIYMYYKKI
ncbi:MAG: DUF998 domain-containing protein [Promethearchaeota archaeon]